MIRLLSSVCVLLFSPAIVWACSCTPLDQSRGYIELLHEAVGEAAGVVQGKVTKLESQDNQVIATLAVEKSFKGDLQDTIQIKTATSGAACGYPFEKEGTRHMLFLHEDEDGAYRVNVCGRSRPLDEARRVVNPLLDADLLTRLRDMNTPAVAQ